MLMYADMRRAADSPKAGHFESHFPHCSLPLLHSRASLVAHCSLRQFLALPQKQPRRCHCSSTDINTNAACHCCLQDLHGGVLLKVSSAAEDEFVRLNLLWTGFFGETCEPGALSYCMTHTCCCCHLCRIATHAAIKPLQAVSRLFSLATQS